MIEFNYKLREEDDEIISLLEKHCNSELEVDLIVGNKQSELFIMDVITDIFQMHYDSKWVIKNINKDDLIQRLSKQKEREKQVLIHKLDIMSDEKERITMELQRTGQSNWFKTSGEENLSRVIDEYTNLPDDGSYTMFNNVLNDTNIVDDVGGIYNGETSELNNQPPYIPEEEQMDIIMKMI